MRPQINPPIRALVLSGALLSAAWAQDIPKPSLKLWYTPVAAIAGANALDYASSVALEGSPNVHESNGLLINNSGQFSPGRAIAIKLGINAAFLLPEYLLIRRYPRLA